MMAFLKDLVPQKIKNIYHLFQALIANLYFGFPSRKMIVIGVTGTNGKTTTCQMISKILEKSGERVAMVSTINFKIGNKEWVNRTKFTTISAWQTQKFIAQAVKSGCKYLVLETSSHSLDQKRVWGINYAVAVITNLTREHLDYHRTMEEYRQAKRKLFLQTKIAVVNLEMDRPEDFLSMQLQERYGFTTKELVENQGNYQNQQVNIVRAEKINLLSTGTDFEALGEEFHLKLLGKFNVENALAAVAVGLSQKIDPKVMKKSLAEIEKVPGRLDEIENDLGARIFIDYALTPDSLKKLGRVFTDLLQPKNQLIWVLGSCGQRDKGKRPLMGEIVASFADKVIITNEDPFGEDPQSIIDQVFSGVIRNKKFKEGENCWRIFDRRQAIKKALSLLGQGDAFLLTGKGAEETMAISAEERIEWNDRRVVREELEKITKKK